MCSEYQTKTSPKEIEEALGTAFLNHVKDFEWGESVKMFKNAPVIQRAGDDLQMVMKSFPSSPLPNARLSGLEGQSDGNDSSDESHEHRQIKRIYEMPRWKEGFANHPVLIPMSGFLEFAYWGENPGTAQEFKVPNEEMFFVAGHLFKPFKPAGNKTAAFTLLTHTATDQMLETHQRLVVILKGRSALGYLEEMSPQERFSYLIEHRYTGKLIQTKFRNMARGWEKRVDGQEAKLRRELEYRKVLEKEGVAG